MAYLQTRPTNQHKKNWICVCKRKNSNEDTFCAFCRSPRPEKVKGQGKVKSSRCFYDGRWYQSKKEMEYAKELDFRMKAGEVLEWKPQHKIEIVVNGKKICSYFCDFLVTLKDGSRVYAEVKGFETQLWRMKWKLCMALKDTIDPGAEWIVIK